jgi:steroid 5-alpha reductase family enzyme
MFDWIVAAEALGVLLIIAVATWPASVYKRDVSIVDSVWPVFFLAALSVYTMEAELPGPRAPAMLALVGLWAIRLSTFLTWRNWGEPEDRRYQEIRRRNQPAFAVKSLVIVFFLQACLAWVISWPLFPALVSVKPWGGLDSLGAGLAFLGIGLETVADWQLARFKAQPENRGVAFDGGLWRYSRHPNYFGEFCVWWGIYLLGAAAGASIWLLVSPVLISFLLLKVSGVPLLEKDIGERRPGYADYQARTSAFFPLPPRRNESLREKSS